MKSFTLSILAGALAVTGCASSNETSRVAGAPAEETYVPLGTLIAKKTSVRKDNQSVDMQSFENNRTIQSGGQTH